MVFTGTDALSLAANIFQVIEFSAKIVSKGKELYKSEDGVLRENEATETVASRLQEMSQRLISSLASEKGLSKEKGKEQLKITIKFPTEDSENHEISKSDDKLLRKICANCVALSQELLDHMGKLRVPKDSGNRKWKSFRQALKSVWSKKGVDEMARRLADARKDLDTFVLIQVRFVA
jgi:preprotein translocase subunit SecA